MAGYREAFIRAEAYRRRWDEWLKNRKGTPPDRDLQLETLAEVLRGHILVHNHCYRADEMAQMLDLAHEFGFKIRSFHHVVEGYKIADLLAREGTAASVWADWCCFKMESFDAVPQNAALITQAGARAIIHSDDPVGIQRLNQEAAKAMYAGQEAGIPITREQAIRWVTANPAWALGIDSLTGTLEPGKVADVVLWSGDPVLDLQHRRPGLQRRVVGLRQARCRAPAGGPISISVSRLRGWDDEAPAAAPGGVRRPGCRKCPDHRHYRRHPLPCLRSQDRERHGADSRWPDRRSR